MDANAIESNSIGRCIMFICFIYCEIEAGKDVAYWELTRKRSFEDVGGLKNECNE